MLEIASLSFHQNKNSRIKCSDSTDWYNGVHWAENIDWIKTDDDESEIGNKNIEILFDYDTPTKPSHWFRNNHLHL